MHDRLGSVIVRSWDASSPLTHKARIPLYSVPVKPSSYHLTCGIPSVLPELGAEQWHFGVGAAGSLVIVLWAYYSAQMPFSVRSSPYLFQQVGFTSRTGAGRRSSDFEGGGLQTTPPGRLTTG
jgi:hypothetical protein